MFVRYKKIDVDAALHDASEGISNILSKLDCTLVKLEIERDLCLKLASTLTEDDKMRAKLLLWVDNYNRNIEYLQSRLGYIKEGYHNFMFQRSIPKN